MHPLLERQINRCLGGADGLPVGWADFFAAVGDAYARGDADRRMVERSLDEMSQELTERNRDLRGELEARRVTEKALLAEKAEQTALIRKLEEAHNQLLQSEKLASIGQLAAGVAHEINNPIGFVNSNLGTLAEYVDSLLAVLAAYEIECPRCVSPEVQQRIDAVRAAAEIDYLRKDIGLLLAESREGLARVKRIVQDLKDFSRVDAGDWEWADLHRGLDSTLNVVNNEIKYKADLVKEYGRLPQVECLASQLNQVFMNLVVNAAHAIAERGTITIRTGTLDDAWVWIEIADTGSGISPENMKRIFDPFFTTKSVGQGTGLGLSLSYGIVRKHGGRLEVASEPGVGTTFKVILPVRAARELTGNPSDATISSQASR